MEPTSKANFSSAGFIEPALCFTKKKIKIGENYPLEKLPVSKLIDKNQVLLEFSDNDLDEGKNIARRPVATGPNTYLSEDTNQVIATVIGYPYVKFVPAAEASEQVLHTWVEPLFQLSKDRMNAHIVIKPLLFNNASLSSEDLYKMLTKTGIIHGIVYKQLNITKECIRNQSLDIDHILVAQGRKPIHGRDAYLKFKFEIGPIAGELLKNGKIDFRERKIMVPVAKNQIIATKVPPTFGKPGMTVLGSRLIPQPGRDIKIETSGDAEYVSEKNQVIATNDGVLSVVGNNIIKVYNKLEITGDIDYSTGNIESRNSVVIHGSVLPGFLVKTGGDLEIKGSVMSTQVASLANIVIKGGITGNVSSVTSSGDTDIHFIEQGMIQCQGNCIIRKQSYYSKIYAGGSIRCKEQGTVVGGEIIAEGCITLGEAGGSGAEPVFIAAGVMAQRIFHSRKLSKRLEEHEDSIIQRLKQYKGVARTKKMKTLKGGIEEMKLRSLRINMIPGTGIFSRPLIATEEEGGKSVTQNDQPEAEHFDIGNISIDVYGTLYAGTLLQIGNSTLTIEKNITKQRFKLDDTRLHIIPTPLR